MAPSSTDLRVRVADLSGTDAVAVGQLVGAYLLQTEREKVDNLHGRATELSEVYRAEIDNPARSYEHATVYLAELVGRPVGVIVVMPGADACEIKRVWVDPDARGQGAASALMSAAIDQVAEPVRLTVWDWRDGAIRLYERRGFVRAASWDARTRLVCMVRRH